MLLSVITKKLMEQSFASGRLIQHGQVRKDEVQSSTPWADITAGMGQLRLPLETSIVARSKSTSVKHVVGRSASYTIAILC